MKRMLVCLIVLSIFAVSGVVSASDAAPTPGRTPALRIVAGGTYSRGLGEQSIAPFVRLTATADLGSFRMEATPFYDWSHKYTGKGYIYGVDGAATTLVGSGLLVIGRLDWHHRNGGDFTKEVLLAGGGLGWEFGGTTISQFRLTGMTEAASRNADNRVRQIQAAYRMYGRAGHMGLSAEVATTFQSYHRSGGGAPASGVFMQASFGFSF